jgi:hypothetical protein
MNKLIQHPEYELWASHGFYVRRPRVSDARVTFKCDIFGTGTIITMVDVSIQIDTGADFSFFSKELTDELLEKCSLGQLPVTTIEYLTFLRIRLSSDSLNISNSDLKVFIDKDGEFVSSIDGRILMLGLSDFELLSLDEINFNWKDATWQMKKI